MYYKKERNNFPFYKGKLTIEDFSLGMNGKKQENLLPLNCAYISNNFAFSSGALTDGVGVNKAKFNCGGSVVEIDDFTFKPLAVYYYNRFDYDSQVYKNYVLCYADDGFIYGALIKENCAFTKINGISFDSVPSAVCYNYNGVDVIIFSVDGVMKIYDGLHVTTITDAPSITSMCIHNERLFATSSGDKTSLWFSDDFNPTNWNVSLDDAGFIDIKDGKGCLLKVVSFAGYVYAFSHYGISRISAFGDQTQFDVDTLVLSSGKIYANSITLCGNAIIYLAQDGFYTFNGQTSHRILSQYDKFILTVDNENSKGQYYNGVFYANVNMLIDDVVQSVLLVYNLADKSLYICKNLNIRDMTVVNGQDDYKLIFILNNQNNVGELCYNSQIFGLPLNKVWQSGITDFGISEKQKTISKICVYSKTSCTIKIIGDNGSKLLNLKGSNKLITANVGLSSCNFKFVISCLNPLSNISKLTVFYEFCK